MFLIRHSLPVTDDKYETPTFLLRQNTSYAPLVKLTNNVNYLREIDFATQDLLTFLETMLSLMEQVEDEIQTSTESQLVFLRENYPLKNTSYAKSSTTNLLPLFSNNNLVFEDDNLTVIYNELLTGERLTLTSQVLILNLNNTLNDNITRANKKLNFINLYGNANLSTIDLVTNYREQNYISLIEDKINEVKNFFETYYENNYAD